MTCETCEIIKGRKGEVLYEDSLVYIVLSEKPSAEGHLIIHPKKHAISVDELSKEEMNHLLQVANICASSMFDTLGAHGTNILMNEGELFNEHLSLNVVARKQDDGLNFNWTPKELDQGKMDSALKGIKDKADLIGMEAPVPEQAHEPEPISEDNPMIDHFRGKLP